MKYKIGDRVSWDSAAGKVSGIVVDRIDAGVIPNIALEIYATSDNPGYLLECDRGQVLVGKLERDLLLEQSQILQGESLFPPLSDSLLRKINSFVPEGFPPVTGEGLTAVKFTVADNLVNRGKGKWVEKDLQVLVKMLNTMGIPHTLDHDWENIEKAPGVVLEGILEKFNTAPPEILTAADNKEWNSKIIAKEGGYFRAVATVALRIDSSLVQNLQFGIGRAVSLGGFAFKDYVCPICDTSFTFKNCPHYIPGGWDAWGEDTNLVAPYYIRDGLYDLGELSSVLIANLPGATALVGNAV
jgi:hypothetical protein